MVIYTGLWSGAAFRNNQEDDDTADEREHLHPRCHFGVTHISSTARKDYGAFERAKMESKRRTQSFYEGQRLQRHDTTGEDSANAKSNASLSSIMGSSDEDVPSLTAAFQRIENRPILLNCLYYLAIYFAVAVIAYSYVFERWTIIDSLYFATNTFTTCGYGDLEPTTIGGQLFTICFAIYGVIILGVFIGIAGASMSEAQARATRKLRKKKEGQILETLFRSERYDKSAPVEETGFWRDHVSMVDDVWRVVRAEFPTIATVAMLAIILGIRERWSMTSTLYFSIMAATTTGYGDYTPRTQADKLYSVFFLPIAVAVFGEVLGRIATVYIQRKQRISEAKFLHRTLTLCDLRNMDTNDDGAVDREEFILFMLLALQKVDRSTIHELRDIFDSLDTNDNGLLEFDDLIEYRQENYLPAFEHVQDAVANSGLGFSQQMNLEFDTEVKHRRHNTII